MKTYKFKDAIKVLAHGGFIKEPGYYFSTHCPLFNKFGTLVGQVTSDCYFEITDALGWTQHNGVLKSGKYRENAKSDDAWHYSTISGDFDLVVKMKEVS